MKSHQCPHCLKQAQPLRFDSAESAPKRWGLTWPRGYCPHCGVQLRSSNRSLWLCGLLFVLATVTQLSGLAQPQWSTITWPLGWVLWFGCMFSALGMHRWEVVNDE